jgi:hypothetical protein
MSYSTNFPLTEDPISEGGHWINGKTTGIDWFDVATQPGLAFGTEAGVGGFTDSTAVLTGNWQPDQTVQGTVHSINQNPNVTEEVELRLRTTIIAHSITGYEINLRCLKGNAASYTEIVRWNGPLGDFTVLSHQGGEQFGVADGDVVSASIAGSLISVSVNGSLVEQTTDATYTTGSPGIGFGYFGSFTHTDSGWTHFSASN